MTKNKSKPQAKRAKEPETQDLDYIVSVTAGADHYRIEGDTVYICAQNGYIIKAIKKV